MDELRVPKRRVPIEVTLTGGATRPVVLFLAEYSLEHAGPERVADLVNGPGNFIPAVDADTKATSFINRESIAVVRFPIDLERETPEESPLATKHEVEVTLVDGSNIRGAVSYVLPPNKARMNDFLNESDVFFRVLEKSRVALVNKRQVAQVDLLKR
jgi:hypothetical protein